MAYTIPVIIIGGCWFAWRHQAATNTSIILPSRCALLARWR
jgi:DNA segregation ATPase FtsK/SpoIIIE-like protein